LCWNFEASNGWLHSFRTQRTNSWFLSGESAVVDIEAVEDWKEKLHQVTKYPLSNKFNADEMDCFIDKCQEKSLRQQEKKKLEMGNHQRRD
jgi:hypothetical protein